MSTDPTRLDVDLYEVLGIERDATTRDVTAAYRRLARMLHPDTNDDPDADERFRAVSAAYEVLRDPRGRAAYDRARRIAASSVRRRPGGGYTIPVENRNRPVRPPATAPDDHPAGDGAEHVSVTVPVSFSEAVLGADVTVPAIGGERVTVRVRPGTASGTVLRVRGRGAPSAAGRGDLLITIQIDVPRRLTAPQRELIRRLADHDDPSLRDHLETWSGRGGTGV